MFTTPKPRMTMNDDPNLVWNRLVEAARAKPLRPAEIATEPPPGFATRVCAVWHDRCVSHRNFLLPRWRRAAVWGLSFAVVCMLVVPECFPEPVVLLSPPELLPLF
jgi:hypothetical protein